MNNIGPSTPGTAWFLDGISNLQNQQAQIQRQLTSGFQVRDAADAPTQAPELVRLGSSLAAVQTYQNNLQRIQTEAGTADQALSSAITLIQNAQALAVQGATATATPEGRKTIAVQIQGIQQQLVSIANTSQDGRFIFGGSRDQSAPYAYDAASATGVDALTAPGSDRVVTDTLGQPVYTGLTAKYIFDPTDATGAPTADNTFAALQSLVTALQANDTAGTANALSSVETASSYVIQQQAQYGAAEQRITAEQSSASAQATALQVQISGIRDTDVVRAATELTQLTTNQSAALGAQVSISRKSLFDYLG